MKEALVLAFLGSIGWPEMMVILIVALLIFGNRLPEVMRALGRSANEFKKGMNEVGDQLAAPPAAQPSAPPAAAPPASTASHPGGAPEEPKKA